MPSRMAARSRGFSSDARKRYQARTEFRRPSRWLDEKPRDLAAIREGMSSNLCDAELIQISWRRFAEVAGL